MNLFQRTYTNDLKYMSRCAPSLAIKEMQIEIMRYHFSPAWMTIKKKKKLKPWQDSSVG